MKKLYRRIIHLGKSGCFLIGLEHFLVMFPSAMLVARLANTAWGAVIELPSILLACGVGTIVFSIFTKRTIPFFLGPSFSYIGFVSYQVASISSPDDIVTIRATILYGYIIAGVILLLLSWLYRYDLVKKIISTLFPSTIMGPAISLIGLELANMAAQDAGFTDGNWEAKVLSLITLGCIIIFSLLRHHFFQNASILIGVFGGCIIATVIGYVTWPGLLEFNIQLPRLYLSSLNYPPDNWITLFLAVFPCAMIAFIESLGRITVYEGMLKRDEKPFDEKMSNKAITIQSVTGILTAATSMMPSAIYAENLAIMNLHSAELSTKHTINEDDDVFINNCYSTYSIYPYVIAAIISILVAFISGLQEFFVSIPMPILGGMELFVFALISAPGIQMLVDQQVNYKKISNQIITSAVLLAGISDISITYGSLTLRGMSLGLTIGVVVNMITLLLGRFGYLNEKFELNEILDECINLFDSKVELRLYGENSLQLLNGEVKVSEFKEYIRQRDIIKKLKQTVKIEMQDCGTKKSINIFQDGQISLEVEIFNTDKKRLTNDNQYLRYSSGSNKWVTFFVDEYVSKRLLLDILKCAKTCMQKT